MFKQLSALLRGRAFDRAEAVVDRNAVVILRQQVRDVAAAVEAARRAIAVATAQNEQEASQHARLVARIADLETRAVSALEQEKMDLAREAAEAIALLEVERETSQAAQQRFVSEIERLKRIVRAAESRLRELRRGQRLAAAAETTQRLRESGPECNLSTLRDAEQTLERLRLRQGEIDATALAIEEMDRASDPAALSEKLAAAGCGAPSRASADAVLARLKERVAPPA